MEVLHTLILIVHVMAALGIIGLVLLQHGKGADMGAAFGSGSSGSLFGATGSANFLSRTTAVLAAVFFATSLGLGYLATHKPRTDAGLGVMDSPSKEQPAVPMPSVSAPPADKPASGETAGKAGESGTSKANEVPK
jgi:preprotein translocase subunit SecG